MPFRLTDEPLDVVERDLVRVSGSRISRVFRWACHPLRHGRVSHRFSGSAKLDHYRKLGSPRVLG